jgi:hypothetical protein
MALKSPINAVRQTSVGNVVNGAQTSAYAQSRSRATLRTTPITVKLCPWVSNVWPIAARLPNRSRAADSLITATRAPSATSRSP